MEIFNIGPLELIIFLVIAFLLLGPKGMVLTAYKIGQAIRKFVRSPMWREILNYSQEIRELPKKIMDETGLEEELKAVRSTTDEALKEVNTSLKEAAQAAKVPEAEHIKLETSAPTEKKIAPPNMAALPSGYLPGDKQAETPETGSSALAEEAPEGEAAAISGGPVPDTPAAREAAARKKEALLKSLSGKSEPGGDEGKSSAQAEPSPGQEEPAPRKRATRKKAAGDSAATAAESAAMDVEAPKSAEAVETPAPRKRATRKKAAEPEAIEQPAAVEQPAAEEPAPRKRSPGRKMPTLAGVETVAPHWEKPVPEESALSEKVETTADAALSEAPVAPPTIPTEPEQAAVELPAAEEPAPRKRTPRKKAAAEPAVTAADSTAAEAEAQAAEPAAKPRRRSAPRKKATAEPAAADPAAEREQLLAPALPAPSADQGPTLETISGNGSGGGEHGTAETQSAEMVPAAPEAKKRRPRQKRAAEVTESGAPGADEDAAHQDDAEHHADAAQG